MIEVFTDGASAGNPGPSGAGIYIKRDKGEVETYTQPLGLLSNHEAELVACIKAMEICLEKGYTQVSFRTDSKLVDQCVANRQIKNKVFQPYLAKILSLEESFTLFFMKWVPSSQNKQADQLARKGIRQNKLN